MPATSIECFLLSLACTRRDFPAVRSRLFHFISLSQHTISGSSCMAVSLSLHRLKVSNATARRSFGHDTNAALGPPQAPRHGQSGTLSLHFVWPSTLRIGIEFYVYFVHSTEHVAHTAVCTTIRGWPISCANVERKRISIHALTGLIAPHGRADSGVGLATTLPCPDTHSLPQLRWLTPLRSCATHHMPSRYVAIASLPCACRVGNG